MAQTSIEDLLRAVLKAGSSATGTGAARQLAALLENPTAGPYVARKLAELLKRPSPNAMPVAVVQTAFAVSETELQSLKDKLEARFGEKLEIRVMEEPSLIGGVRVTVGDNVLDASIKGSIEKMKQALAA
jgi:F-type H+-transporting ATPase subunit delta